MYRFCALCGRSVAVESIVVVIGGLYPRRASDQGCGWVTRRPPGHGRPPRYLPGSAEGDGPDELLRHRPLCRLQRMRRAVIEQIEVLATDDEVGQIPGPTALVRSPALDDASAHAGDACRAVVNDPKTLDMLTLIAVQRDGGSVERAVALRTSRDGKGFAVEALVVVVTWRLACQFDVPLGRVRDAVPETL